MLSLTSKQKEFWKNANCRWNIKSGATRSGKTFLDYYLIPKRIRAVAGKDGLNVILGNTKGTLQRNIIEPLQNIWSPELVSDIKSDNTAVFFGEKVYCLGADKVNQVDKLRGSSIKYCYGDEVVTWHEEVFTMLKSRLDKGYSCFDGTCNPEGPNHWFKKFIDNTNLDIFSQSYTIYDNPFNDAKFVEELEKEYAGTIFYDRYILGKWKHAEGIIYKRFADDPERFEIERSKLPNLIEILIGVDFGGNGSNHAFVCSGIDWDYNLYALKSESIPATGTDVNDLINELINFVTICKNLYGVIDGIYCDAAEQTIINTVRNRLPEYFVYNSFKNEIIDRVRALIILTGSDRFRYVKGENDALVEGISQAMWDSKSTDKDKRLDDGTTDIDILDAFEYSFEKNIYYFGR